MSGPPPPPSLVATADGSATLVRAEDGVWYRSRHGALTEVRHVFVEGSGVGARLRAGQPTRVLDVGFGGGLTALATLAEAHRSGTPCHVVSLEAAPVPPEAFAALGYAEALGLPLRAAALAAWYAGATAPGAHVCAVAPGCTLTLVVGDARTSAWPGGPFEAAYLDAFAPAVNPDLYALPFLERLGAALAPGGTLATYVAQGAFRRALRSAGFAVHARPGAPGKRECTAAVRPA